MALAIAGGFAGGFGGGLRTTDAAPAGWDAPPCPPAMPGDGADRGVGWFRLEPVLDAEGWLVAQEIQLGVMGGATHVALLDAESFASGPRGGRIVIGTDDGKRSRVHVVDAAAGCAVEAGTRRDVVRSAILSADGTRLIEHRVDRRSRADLGVWEVSLAGGHEVRLLAGLPADEAHGPTFSTVLVDGSEGELAAVSCGEAACRARVLDGSGGVRLTPGIGDPIGLARGALVVYAPCPSLPCGIERIDANGTRTELMAGAGHAVLAGGDDPSLVVEQPEDPGGHLTVVALDSGAVRAIAGPPGLRLQPAAHRAFAAAETPAASVLLARDGRVGGDIAASRLLDVATGRISVPGEEE
ncbi:MAG TPA: hypothetical protein VFK54_10435 [Candidatus Limnocylindrales bacterium]|nr:hypothetical protein [Candidatus Limnocylindrales bacterium]